MKNSRCGINPDGNDGDENGDVSLGWNKRESWRHIVESQMYTPGKAGPVVYLNANPNFKPGLSRVEKAGEKISMPNSD